MINGNKYVVSAPLYYRKWLGVWKTKQIKLWKQGEFRTGGGFELGLVGCSGVPGPQAPPAPHQVLGPSSSGSADPKQALWVSPRPFHAGAVAVPFVARPVPPHGPVPTVTSPRASPVRPSPTLIPLSCHGLVTSDLSMKRLPSDVVFSALLLPASQRLEGWKHLKEWADFGGKR